MRFNPAPDKWRHFWVGLAMGIIFTLMGNWLMPGHPMLARGIILAVIIAISYGFELYSKFTGRGVYEILDAVASIIGGLAGMGSVIGIEWLLNRATEAGIH